MGQTIRALLWPTRGTVNLLLLTLFFTCEKQNGKVARNRKENNVVGFKKRIEAKIILLQGTFG
jgi:hypothetical protein